MSNVIRFFRPDTLGAKTQRHALEGLERVTTPPLESSNYEFMLENLMDLPSDRFDRWRNRMPQG